MSQPLLIFLAAAVNHNYDRSQPKPGWSVLSMAAVLYSVIANMT